MITDDEFIPDKAVLLPLDGAAATTQPAESCSLGSISLAGSTMLYTCERDIGTDDQEFALERLNPGATIAAETVGTTWFHLTNAYGQAVADSPDQAALLRVTGSGAVSTVVSRRWSPVTVGSFALTAGQIVYSDDQRVAAGPTVKESAFSRTVSLHAGHVHLGPATLLHRTATPIVGNLVGASDALRVYATRGSAVDGIPTATLHVLSSKGTTSVTGATTGTLQVSGHFLLYQVNTPTTSLYKVYDASTRTSKVVRTVAGTLSIALWHGDIAWASTDGVFREHLASRATIRIAKPVTRRIFGQPSVAIFGNWVGWHFAAVPHRIQKAIDRIRNSKTMSGAISLPHTLYKLTATGALLSNSEFSVPQATAFWLHHYSGGTRKVLSKRIFLAGPQIAGGVISWAGADGVLKVSPLG